MNIGKWNWNWMGSVSKFKFLIQESQKCVDFWPEEGTVSFSKRDPQKIDYLYPLIFHLQLKILKISAKAELPLPSQQTKLSLKSHSHFKKPNFHSNYKPLKGCKIVFQKQKIKNILRSSIGLHKVNWGSRQKSSITT